MEYVGEFMKQFADYINRKVVVIRMNIYAWKHIVISYHLGIAIIVNSQIYFDVQTYCTIRSRKTFQLSRKCMQAFMFLWCEEK